MNGKHVSLPLLSSAAPASLTAPSGDVPWLLTELQSRGLRWLDDAGPGLARTGGAGPSDHKAITLDGHTVMVPIFNQSAARSPYLARVDPGGATATIERAGERLARVSFPRTPRFYERATADGTPYWKIATLHGSDVLATTVLQTCIRYARAETACQFCAIGQSLAAGATIARKSPGQLAEVARAAQELDGIRHVVLTTGTPKTSDRGASVLADAARAIRDATGLPIQAQCEPPADDAWFGRLYESGVATLGMHIEAVSEPVRRALLPGKSEVPLARYFEAFATAVGVFGRGQVTTYILAGLGDTAQEILETTGRLVALGVYPFVVPFVPIAGTPLAGRAPPAPAFMRELLASLARQLRHAGLSSAEVRAGCARCGACSSLSAYEAHA